MVVRFWGMGGDHAGLGQGGGRGSLVPMRSWGDLAGQHGSELRGKRKEPGRRFFKKKAGHMCFL